MHKLILLSFLCYAGVFSLLQNEDSRQCCNIEVELGGHLSHNAAIVMPDSDQGQLLQVRASSPRIRPKYTAIVEVATERDIQHTIKYANRCGLDFLAVSGGHGWQSTLGNASNAIQINMRRMQDIKVDGNVVRIGGGVLQKQLVETLYWQQKQAVTGLCECTSIIGPLLGGGHSVLQGRHGLVSDNLVSARLVLASGEALTISADSHPDLFWAIRGAGHNFGIVASAEINVFDLPKTGWTIASLIYTQDRLIDFVEALNDVNNEGDHDANLVLAGAITRIPGFQNAVIAYQLSYLGDADGLKPYLERFKQARPVIVDVVEDIPYKDYYILTNNGYNQTTCQKDRNIKGYAVSVPALDITATQTVYDLFNEFTADSLFNQSVVLLEAYGFRSVRHHGGSAVPRVERDLSVINSAVFWWSGQDPAALQKADHYGQLIQSAVAAGNGETMTDAHVYLNYASGGENLEQIYGEEDLGRLRELKSLYDPYHRFRFYMPIT